MRQAYKSFLFLFVALMMAGMFTACSEEDALPNGGKPMVSYIRVTRPAAADSLIVKAGQGSMIAIVGQNLQNAVQVWFNNRPAQLTPTYITNTSIITRVPTEIPTRITNKMKIIFANGDSLLHDFKVEISEPVVNMMLSEHVPAGKVATIYGNYFYTPVKVAFTGANNTTVLGEVVKVQEGAIEVTVPEGAQPGPITVETNFGKTPSKFWFRDNRNVIASFDGSTSGMWHGPAFIVASDPDIAPISNKFIRINKELSAWGWFEMYVGPNNSDVRLETRNIPADAFANPAKYVIKFEINTLKPLTGAHIRMYMGTGNMGSERNNTYYNWQPNVDTKSQWQTVTIPWEDFWVANKRFAHDANGYGVSFHFSGPNAVVANFGLDNMRVVPK